MKTKTSATLMLLLTFLLGGVAGALSYHLYRGRFTTTAARGGPRPGQRDLMKEMAKDLGLDAMQQERLTDIMKQSREQYRALYEQVRPQFDQIREQTHTQIRQILRDDQKTRFEDRLKEIGKRRRDRSYHPDTK